MIKDTDTLRAEVFKLKAELTVLKAANKSLQERFRVKTREKARIKRLTKRLLEEVYQHAYWYYRFQGKDDPDATKAAISYRREYIATHHIEPGVK